MSTKRDDCPCNLRLLRLLHLHGLDAEARRLLEERAVGSMIRHDGIDILEVADLEERRAANLRVVDGQHLLARALEERLLERLLVKHRAHDAVLRADGRDAEERDVDAELANHADGEIAEKAQSSRYEGFIDPDFKAFSVICDMPSEVKKYCADTLQSVPESEGDVARCIYESLALKYRENVELIERLTGKHYDAIQIVGGGTNNKLMNGFTANATGKKVIAGPVEATATGNVLMQMIYGGDIKSIKEGSEVVSASEILSVYEPEDKALWDEKYEKYLKVTKK